MWDFHLVLIMLAMINNKEAENKKRGEDSEQMDFRVLWGALGGAHLASSWCSFAKALIFFWIENVPQV